MDFAIACWNIRGMNTEFKQNEAMRFVKEETLQVIIGDFNVTININEHSVGGSNVTIDMIEFREARNKLEVDDIGSSGMFFTWTKSLKSKQCSTLKKLDRIMVNDELISSYPQAHGRFLPYLISDHSPAVLIFKEEVDRKGRSFRFSNFITEKEGYLELIQNEWEGKGKGFHMYRLVQNLKKLKKALKRLSWKNGNVFEKVSMLKEKLRKDQEACDKNPHNEMLKREVVTTLKEYMVAANDEIKLLHQKVKVQWLKEGDRNTAYFHSILKARRNKSKVEVICDDMGNKYEGEEVADQFFKHFEKFLEKVVSVEPLMEGIFKNVLSNEEANAMVRNVTDEEIKEALFDIDSNKAAGPNGFTSGFFKKAWNVIGKDVCDGIKEIFLNGKLLGDLNATLIALIPKIATPNRVSDFRPIACCNIDIRKAYDTVSWSFLGEILNNIGFHEKMVQWIMTCVTTTKFSICLNGEMHGYFKGGRGLRQGNPLSPYLFTLVMEVFNLIMCKNIEDSKDYKYYFGCKELNLSHICFVDDLLVLCKGDLGSVKVVKKPLEEFSSVSGLVPNLGKSTIFFGSIAERERQDLLQILPFKCGKLPVRYLGVPLLAEKLGVADWRMLVEKLYWASVYMLPLTVIKEIEKCFKSFLWNSEDNESLWARWVNVVKLKHNNIWTVKIDKQDSWGWKTMLDIRDMIRGHVRYVIGNGRKISIWYDKWYEDGPLYEKITRRDVYNARLGDDFKIADMFRGGNWMWPVDWMDKFHFLRNIRIPNLQEEKNDGVMWVNNKAELVDLNVSNLQELVNVIAKNRVQNNIVVAVNKLLLAATVYFIWQERNRRVFNKEERSEVLVCRLINETIKYKLMSLSVKKSWTVDLVAKRWNLTWSNNVLVADSAQD
uniref:uncharacterized protein LOC122596860 n=1 Tax=Erigeron canadensis TaxID=72917 RepID=UPI001CB94002|nr:uncharacterized protein LOC122596860 [Erigeron canadensis]